MKKFGILVVLFALLAGVLTANAEDTVSDVEFTVEPLVPAVLISLVQSEYAPTVHDYLYYMAFIDPYVDPANPTKAEMTDEAAEYVLAYYLRYGDAYLVAQELAAIAIREALADVDVAYTVPYTVESEAEARAFLTVASGLMWDNMWLADEEAGEDDIAVWKFKSADVYGWLQDFSAAYAADSYSLLENPYDAGYALDDLADLAYDYFDENHQLIMDLFAPDNAEA